MKTIKLAAVLLVALLPGVALAASDMFLQIKPDKGESMIVHCSDGACATEALAAGTWTVSVCTARGKPIVADLDLDYAIVSPRDLSSGQATGKRSTVLSPSARNSRVRRPVIPSPLKRPAPSLPSARRRRAWKRPRPRSASRVRIFRTTDRSARRSPVLELGHDRSQ